MRIPLAPYLLYFSILFMTLGSGPHKFGTHDKSLRRTLNEKETKCVDFSPSPRWPSEDSTPVFSTLLVGNKMKSGTIMNVRTVQLVEPPGLAVIHYEEGLNQLEEERYFAEIVDLRNGRSRESIPDTFKNRQWWVLGNDGATAVGLSAEQGPGGHIGMRWRQHSALKHEREKTGFHYTDFPIATTFSRDPRMALVQFRKGENRLVNPFNLEQGSEIHTGNDTVSLRATFSADAGTLALQVMSTENEELNPKEYRVYKKDGNLLATVPHFTPGDPAFALSADGSQFYFMKGSRLQRLDVATNKITQLGDLGEQVHSMAVSPTEPFMLVGLMDRVKLLSTISGEVVAEIPIGADKEIVRNVGFSSNGHEFYASLGSRFAWNDLNRAGIRPHSVEQALNSLTVPSLAAFQATRYLRCEKQNLRVFLDQILQPTPLPSETLATLEKSVAAWDSDKYTVRQAGSLSALKELEKLNWAQMHLVEKSLREMAARQMAKSSSPREIESRLESLLMTGTLPAFRAFRDSESFRARIDNILEKPLGKTLQK